MDKQQGFMLLEALIAILIFSIGILAIIGLQAASLRASGDAKYRTDANMLINRIIAQMWVSDHTPAQLQATFDSSNAANSATYQTWATEVNNTLPGVSSIPGNLPSITVVPTSGTNVTSSLVTVRINWTLPGESPGTRHTAMSIAQIR